MRICKRMNDDRRDRGVAIVIVLGLIAVLMMMAVAFSIHMRIERTGASYYRYGVQARHMVWAGMANAISDIDDLMKASSTPMYPDWEVKASGGSGDASVLNRVAAEYVPTHLREKVRTAGAKWKYISAAGQSRGRYAFAIVNSSGLLDANRVDGRLPLWTRHRGEDSYEIQLDNVPGMGDPERFANLAESAGRYETLPELTNNNEEAGDGRAFAAFTLSPVENKYDISGETGKRAYVGEETALWKSNEIVAAFADAGVPDPGLAYLNLLDFTDADSEPKSLAAGCVERVPMINEFDFIYQVTFDASGAISGNAGLLIEWVYPFVLGTQERFDMHYDIDVVALGANTVTGAVPEALTGSYDKNHFTGGNAPPMAYGTADRMTAFSASSTDLFVNVAFEVTVSANITDPSNTPLDATPWPYLPANGLKMRVEVPLNRGDTVISTNSWECLDPRFNWVTDGSKPQWYSSAMLSALPGWTITPGTENKVVDVYFNPGNYGLPDAWDLDDDMYMRVADRPLKSLGELSYICYDWWRTVRLYEHKNVPNPYPEANKYHRVMDTFTIWTNEYRRGLVNINTTNVDILASAFYMMPEEEETTNRLISWSAAQRIAREIVNNRPYTNISELGKRQIDWDALTTGPNEMCRESGIRNTAGLLTARDNFFTVIIRADAFSAAMGGSDAKGTGLASARAVAEIWRDPIPDENGQNKCLIRAFRYLED